MSQEMFILFVMLYFTQYSYIQSDFFHDTHVSRNSILIITKCEEILTFFRLIQTLTEYLKRMKLIEKTFFF